MPAFQDLTGIVFGRLTVLRRVENSSGGQPRWLCRCECSGKETTVRGAHLRNGNIKSCGCLQGNVKHGHTRKRKRTAEYRSWLSMIDRCSNPNKTGWKNYGGRGITVCDRWQGDHGFENFLQDTDLIALQNRLRRAWFAFHAKFYGGGSGKRDSQDSK